MAEKQKPIPHIVRVAAKAMKDPESVTPSEVKSMAARILDDQKNDPKPHKPTARPQTAKKPLSKSATKKGAVSKTSRKK